MSHFSRECEFKSRIRYVEVKMMFLSFINRKYSRKPRIAQVANRRRAAANSGSFPFDGVSGGGDKWRMIRLSMAGNGNHSRHQGFTIYSGHLACCLV